MPKRSYPFAGDSDGRLRKNHHSLQDEDKRSFSAMATVHYKTLQLVMEGGKQNGPNNNPTNSCTSCVRTLSELVPKKCSNCNRQTCVNCLSACDSCFNSICGMCSIEDQNNYLRLCLGCRDSRNWINIKKHIYIKENRILIWLLPEKDDLFWISLHFSFTFLGEYDFSPTYQPIGRSGTVLNCR